MSKLNVVSAISFACLFLTHASAAPVGVHSILVEGLSEPQKSDLILHLGEAGIAEGKDQISEDGLRTAAQAITSAFSDRHLDIQVRSAGADQVDLIISAPGPKPLRVGGNVMQANLVQQVRPMYPPEAKANRIQGTVRFDVLIGKDGRVASMSLVSGPPELVETSMEAVRQWVYRPTLLNSDPVEVQTTIDVNYTLSQ